MNWVLAAIVLLVVAAIIQVSYMRDLRRRTISSNKPLSPECVDP
jgi:hypothetical protein